MPDLQVCKPLVLSELNPPMNITLVEDGRGLEKLAKCVSRVGADAIPTAGLDTETNMSVDFWLRRVRTVQFGDKHEQFVIDMLAFAGSEDNLFQAQGHYGKHNKDLFKPVLDILTPVLCTNKLLKVGQNLAFEYEVLNWNFGQRIWNLYSTDLAERAIQAGAISLKKYKEFSMLSLVQRYFHLLINKDEQKGFDLKTPLTQEQIEYAALDIRMPIALRLMQLRVLTQDQLLTTAQIENDALGSYVDMHLTGQRLDCERWLKRIEKVRAQRVEDLKVLDEGFIPIVGRKDEAIDHNELDRLEKIWREGFEKATPAEMQKAVEVRLEKDKEKKTVLRSELDVLKSDRAVLKAEAKKNFSMLSKERTQKQNKIKKCEGEAFINYGSGPQLLEALRKFKGMGGIDSTADDVLLKFNDRPLIQILRKYKKGKKETGTYGEQWTQKWVTKPVKTQGWLHPGDGRLHCLFNQLEAETGRSSSSKPNAMNLPKDDDVRACFICDPPDPTIRISNCCNSDTHIDSNGVLRICDKCFTEACDTHDEEYCIVTVDMSGAELRIIAELAQAKSWITAFAKGQDVHSVSTEILEPEKWPALACKGGEKWFDPEKNKEVILPPCAYYALNEAGEAKRIKCKCPGHVELRNNTKAINFLLCYGGGPDALADELGITTDAAKKLMQLHESKFPDVWGYLKRSGELAQKYKEARDMYGRRRLFPEPTWDIAKEWYKDEYADRLELNDEEQEAALFNFKAAELREPTEDEHYSLTHRAPTPSEIKHGMRALMGSIGRRGKNHCIQGTNASIIKRAMGCGFDKDGKAYLWHLLPQYKAKLLSMVHDELVLQCPKRFGNETAACVGDAFKRAAAEVMTQVVMEHEAHVSNRWMK